MSCEIVFPLLRLLSFHMISLVVFVAYILLAMKKKVKIPYYDIFIYLFTFLAWGEGFFLSDKYGIGFGKTMGNFVEILFIGILMSAYMLIKFTYLLCKNADIPKDISCYMVTAVILVSLFIGILVPGLPE